MKKHARIEPSDSPPRLYEIPPKIRETVSDDLNEELANQDIGPLSDEEAFEWFYYAALRTTSKSKKLGALRSSEGAEGEGASSPGEGPSPAGEEAGAAEDKRAQDEAERKRLRAIWES